MMDISILGEMVGTMGFPIMCCIFMWKYLTTTMGEITKTMVKNTEILQRLADKIDQDQKSRNYANNYDI